MSKPEFLDHLAEMIEMPPGSLKGSERLADLEGWNSIALMSFIAFADEEFERQVAPRDIVNCETVDDLAKTVGVTG